MKKLFFSIVLLVALSCSKKEKKPNALISRAEMSQILIDYHIAERLAAEFSRDPDTNKAVFFSRYYPEVLARYQVSKEAFEQSYNFYSKDFETFQEIYQVVEKKLIQKRDSLELKRESENPQKPR